MSYSVRYPSPALSPYVKLYWSMTGEPGEGAAHIQRIVPTGMADLIFYFEDLPENIHRPESLSSRSVVNGQQTNFFDLKVTGRLDLLSITFTPQGTRIFFNLPISEIQNRNIPLRYLAGPLADELEEKLFYAKDIKSRVEIVESFLIFNLGKKKEYDFRRIDASIKTISRERGGSSVLDLASGACLSRKQFERSFSSFVGLSPKQFLRIIRFQNAIAQKQKNPSISLTDIAYRSGYSDQSHMVREFLRISGLPPGKYFSSCDPISDYFS